MTDDDNLIDKENNVDEDELDRRIRELGLDQTPSIEKAREEAAKIDDEFENRLRSLESKVESRKQVREGQQREDTRRLEGERESARGLGVGLSIAYTIIGMPILGIAVGWLIDEKAGTQIYKSVGVLVGSILGIVMTFILLARDNRRP